MTLAHHTYIVVMMSWSIISLHVVRVRVQAQHTYIVVGGVGCRVSGNRVRASQQKLTYIQTYIHTSYIQTYIHQDFRSIACGPRVDSPSICLSSMRSVGWVFRNRGGRIVSTETHCQAISLLPGSLPGRNSNYFLLTIWNIVKTEILIN